MTIALAALPGVKHIDSGMLCPQDGSTMTRRRKMKRTLIAMGVLAAIILVLGTPPLQAAPPSPPDVTIELLNPPPGGLLELAVGESYTFDVAVESEEPFLWAIAMTDEYYPGRALYWHGMDRAIRDTSALLSLTMTGKKPSTDLDAVCDWPEPGDCWPEGVAPASIVVAVRFQGGGVAVKQFAFAVLVP
jgi:hypothetical protein